MPKTICLDFDGVMSDYHGWRGEDHLDPPRPGLRAFLEALTAQGYTLVIHTTRDRTAIYSWLIEYRLDEVFDHDPDRIVRAKPPAVAYIDDRAVCFRGDYDATLQEVLTFRAYWEET